jgi:hypothetical protein
MEQGLKEGSDRENTPKMRSKNTDTHTQTPSHATTIHTYRIDDDAPIGATVFGQRPQKVAHALGQHGAVKRKGAIGQMHPHPFDLAERQWGWGVEVEAEVEVRVEKSELDFLWTRKNH